MKNKFQKFLFILAIVGMNIPAFSQQAAQISIVDPGQLYSTFEFSAVDQQTVVATVGAEKYNEINNAIHESQWPSGLATLDKRTQNRELIRKFSVTVIMALDDKSIVEIAPGNNSSMPAELRSDKPFYFLIGTEGLGNAGGNAEAVENSDENYFDDFFPQAAIVDPGQIMSSYQFEESEIQDIVEQIGEDGYAYINENCRENVWPAGIATLSKRLNAADQIKQYNAYLVAQSGDFSILEITPEENSQMGPEFIPQNTFYFVIKTKGIEILDY